MTMPVCTMYVCMCVRACVRVLACVCERVIASEKITGDDIQYHPKCSKEGVIVLLSCRSCTADRDPWRGVPPANSKRLARLNV